MPTATWNGAVIAESDRSVVIEGNHSFPADSVRRGHLEPSTRQTVCSWKGTASYYDVVVDCERNADAAWCYPEPLPAAAEVAGPRRLLAWRRGPVWTSTGQRGRPAVQPADYASVTVGCASPGGADRRRRAAAAAGPTSTLGLGH